MRIKRRNVLASAVALVSGVTLLSRFRGKAIKPLSIESTFTSMIDAFIPADQDPGAVDIGIDEQLYEMVLKNEKYTQVVANAMDVLQRIALGHYQQSFDQLSLLKRSQVIEQLLQDELSDQDARNQVANLRAQALAKFYTSVSAFQMLAYHSPSQGGYSHYASPPL